MEPQFERSQLIAVVSPLEKMKYSIVSDK